MASRLNCSWPPTNCARIWSSSDYKHVALGLIFLRHISNAFEAKQEALLAEDPAAAEDPGEYLAENVFWVPKEARWSHLQANARQPTIGKVIDDAMLAIEASNASLKGVLPKDYNRPALDKVMLGELIDLISGIAMHETEDKAKDILGWVNISSRLCRRGRQKGRGAYTRARSCAS